MPKGPKGQKNPAENTEEAAARLCHLRAEVKLGFDAIDRGEYRELDRLNLAPYIRSLGKRVRR